MAEIRRRDAPGGVAGGCREGFAGGRRCGERIADGWEESLVSPEGCRWYPGLFNF